MDPRQHVGANMQRARKAAGLKQEEAAAALDVHKVTVSEWENGRQLPDEATRIRMAELYGVSVGELCYGAESEAFRRGILAAAEALHELARLAGPTAPAAPRKAASVIVTDSASGERGA